MQNQQNQTKIHNLILNSKYPLILAHENPDGDTLGASLALSSYLDKKDKKHKLFCVDNPPRYFNFLPKIEKIISNAANININEHDLVITIDCGALTRTGLQEIIGENRENLILINIDHHHSNDNYGDYNLVAPLASSTSEIMYTFFSANLINIDKYTATHLLTGILSDTMNFTNAATSQSSLKVSSELLRLGARISQITDGLSRNKNLPALQLWGKIISRTQIQPEYNFAYTTIMKEDFSQTQIQREEIDGLANFLSTLYGVNFILVLSEEDNDIIKGSLRTTKDEIDVAKIAQIFNGGGHKKAAGFKIPKKETAGAQDWKDFFINAIINELK